MFRWKISNEYYIDRSRIPPFCREKPVLWFAQLEEQFLLNDISDDYVKFYYATTLLDPSVAEKVEDIIVSPPSNHKYEILKTELIKRLLESDNEKLLPSLLQEVLVYGENFHYSRHSQNKLRFAEQEELPKFNAMGLLPKAVIKSEQDSTLQECNNNIYHSHSFDRYTEDRMTPLERQMATLNKKVKALTLALKRRRRRRPGVTKAFSRHHRRLYCWYHLSFGVKAKKCTKPCDFKK